MFKSNATSKDESRNTGKHRNAQSIDSKTKIEPWTRSKSTQKPRKSTPVKSPPLGTYNIKNNGRIAGSISLERTLPTYQIKTKRIEQLESSSEQREGLMDNSNTGYIDRSTYRGMDTMEETGQEEKKNPMVGHKMYRDTPLGYVEFGKRTNRKSMKNFSFDSEGKRYEVREDSIVRYIPFYETFLPKTGYLEILKKKEPLPKHGKEKDRSRLL